MTSRESSQELEQLRQEVRYLRRSSEQAAAKILLLDTQSAAIRQELEQKRRGFRLMAELAVTMGQDTDYKGVFVSVTRRINAALNMQRTAVLMPDADGVFKAVVLQGYSADEEELIEARNIVMETELLDPAHPVLITGADPLTRLASFREALALPYLISSPVLLHNKVVALLVTGRLVEQRAFLPRLGLSDVETVQTVSAYLAAMLSGLRLVEAEQRTQIMLDATPLCCNFWDESYSNVDCNQEALRLFGFAGKQEYLDRFFELSPKYQPDGRLSSEMMLETIREAFATGWVRLEWMHQKPNGEPIPAEITLVRVKRGEGYIVAGYTRDLRELKAMLGEMHKTEDELRLARDMAEKNARAKSEFLANMSHEIRTPMNAIVGMTHILSGTELSEKQRNYVDKAEHSANLLLRIINDILDFSKIDAGRMEMENIGFSIHRLTRNVHDLAMGQVTAKSLALRIVIEPDVPDLVMGDPLRLEQVLLNLVNNAVKFTQAGGVDIRVSRKVPASAPEADAVQVLFEVKDTGIGMSQKQMATVFRPFTQADTSTTRKYGGTGLGLVICRSLVEMMNGKIWCESQPGAGSTFSFTATFALPTEDEASSVGQGGADTDPVEAETDFEELRGMRVLLAEDNEINQMIAIELLSLKGVIVDAVGTGLEALQALETSTYDLVLMDIQMPEMDGLTATARIRTDPGYANLPIIAMTAHAMAGDRDVSLEGGMDDHLTKPIDPHQLYATLKRWDRR